MWHKCIKGLTTGSIGEDRNLLDRKGGWDVHMCNEYSNKNAQKENN